SDRLWIPAATAESGATSHKVYPTANSPKPGRSVPSVPAAHAANGPEYGPVRRFNDNLALITKNRPARPVRIARNGSRHRPVRFDLILRHFAKSCPDGLPHGEE